MISWGTFALFLLPLSTAAAYCVGGAVAWPVTQFLHILRGTNVIIVLHRGRLTMTRRDLWGQPPQGININDHPITRM